MERLTRKDILGWDTHNWANALRYWESMLEGRTSLNCLELGANRGGLSLWLAAKGYHVVCSDIRKPLQQTLDFHRRFSYASNITYEIINASGIPYTDAFDVVVLKSVLGGVGRAGNSSDIEKAMSCVHQCLKPGGLFLFAENLRGSKLHSFVRNRFVHWARDWNYPDVAELRRLLDRFASSELRTAGFLGAFGFNEYTRNVFGKIDSVFHGAIPAGWRYIGYGHARK